nr:MAG TPA: hypothetical protein [Caudoviricetes sp.]
MINPPSRRLKLNFIGMKFLLIPLNIYTSSLVGYSLFDYTATLRKQSRQTIGGMK